MSNALSTIVIILLVIFIYEYEKNGDKSLFGSTFKDMHNYVNRSDTTLVITMDNDENILDSQYVIKIHK